MQFCSFLICLCSLPQRRYSYLPAPAFSFSFDSCSTDICTITHTHLHKLTHLHTYTYTHWHTNNYNSTLWSEPIKLEVDQIYHLACPASPPHYQVRWEETRLKESGHTMKWDEMKLDEMEWDKMRSRESGDKITIDLTNKGDTIMSKHALPSFRRAIFLFFSLCQPQWKTWP